MKRIISAGLCTAFILSLAGCARQDTTPSLTAADTTDTQMGRWVESRVDLGGEQLISYPTQLADGTIVLYTGKVGEDSIEDYTRRTSTDGTNWTSEPAAFDVGDAMVTWILVAPDGEQALIAFEHYKPNMLLLDLMLPGIDGYQVCREIRAKSDVPIIMLSAKGEVFDKVLGLELGADDYILKPFDSKELVARVKAVLRRFQPAKPEAYASVDIKCVEYPGLIVNLSNYSVTYDGQQIDMPPKELELLYFLASSPNQVFTREQLLDNIWGYEYVGDTRTVDVHVKRLREKIKDKPTWRIATVWGIGYKFEVK